MPRYVAFLRAVNVGGGSTVKMEVLRRAFVETGFSNVASFIASGNIIFETSARNTDQLEIRIEKALLQTLGHEVTPFVRTGPELARITAFNAFPNSRLDPWDQLGVVFLSAPPDSKAEKLINDFHSIADEFHVHGREIYWLRHTQLESAAYSIVPLDKALSEPFTIRSMSTVRKIAARFFPA